MGGNYYLKIYKEVSQFKLDDCQRIVNKIASLGAWYNQKQGYWSDGKSDFVIGDLEEAINTIYHEGGDIQFFYKNIDFRLSFRFKGYTNIKKYGTVGLVIDRVFFRGEEDEKKDNYIKFLMFVEETYKLVEPIYAESYYYSPEVLVTDELLDKLKNNTKSLNDLKKEMKLLFEINDI
jgi:hypothetical protein